MRISCQTSDEEGALDAGGDLGGDVTRALIADLELATGHSLADYIFKPVQMHFGKMV